MDVLPYLKEISLKDKVIENFDVYHFTIPAIRHLEKIAALLVDHVLPHRPVRQWLFSFPNPLRFVLANHP